MVLCWIEGNWGSYFSYKDGLPTRNKKFDLRRKIDIVLAEPRILSEEVLGDHRATRQYLQRECLALRRTLGLPSEQAALIAASEEEDGAP